MAPSPAPRDARGRRKGHRAGTPPKPSAKPTPAGAPSWVWLLGIVVVTFVAYVPSLDNDFTNWDDPHYVTQNPLLVHPTVHAVLTTPVEGNYHPLTMWSLALNYQLSLLRPASYHWLNLLLHLANTVLTFWFVRRLVGGGFWAPVVTSLLFGIHPMHVESVAWIAERKDVLFAFFYLIGLLTYLRYLEARRPLWWLLTLAAFILSVASKPSAIPFPLTLFAIDWYRRRPMNAALVLEKVPFLLGSVVAGWLTLHAQKLAGAVAENPVWTPFQKVLLAACGTVMYFVKLFVPVGLSAIYPAPNPAAKLGPEFYLSLIGLLIVLPAIVYLFRRDRAVLFGLMFFFINIVLVIQFFSFGIALIADRYTYLPFIGLFFALSSWMDAVPDPSAAGHPMRTLVAGTLALLVPVSLVQTWKRCDVWQNSETMWNDTIRKYPHQIYVAYYYRGYYYHRVTGHPEAALADYDEALRINPRVSWVWSNKGALLADTGQADQALACLNRAIELKPDLADALNTRGALKGRMGDLEGAVADFTRAIAAGPNFRDPYENRAVADYMLHNYELAIADSRRAIELDPDHPDNHGIHDAIGLSLQALDRYREAVAEHDIAIRTAPYGDPRIAGYYLNRSLAWMGLGDRERALEDAQEAKRLGAPVHEEYLKKLGG